MCCVFFLIFGFSFLLFFFLCHLFVCSYVCVCVQTTAAWINMLLLSACGPITTPVAACATAAISMELGVAAIRTGKAKVMFVGGTEDFGEEGSYEFAQMGATSNSIKEAAAGREPEEHCRPCTSSRNGFLESQGAGIQILTTASLALELGLPVFGVVGGVSSATDRQGRSIPAPGVGVLSTAREAAYGSKGQQHPLLSLPYRRRALESAVRAVDDWLEQELAMDGADVEFLHAESERRIDGLRRLHSHEFAADHPHIAPLRGALSMWGLTLDDLEAVSFHGTSTVANDRNESNVVQLQMDHLGRSKGKPLPVIAQKWMSGHPKGSAFAWMLNGMLQSLNSGLIPGNRNLDNPDAYLRKFEQLLYLDKTTNVYKDRASVSHNATSGRMSAG
jgi:3-oxoacyl-(acyl-carrier-protein) synthase